jgi:hypothetical protein
MSSGFLSSPVILPTLAVSGHQAKASEKGIDSGTSVCRTFGLLAAAVTRPTTASPTFFSTLQARFPREQLLVSRLLPDEKRKGFSMVGSCMSLCTEPETRHSLILGDEIHAHQ